MRIALIQKNIVIGDFSGTLRKYRGAYQQACEAGADLCIFPELATTGYPPRDLLARAPFIAGNLEMVAELTEWTAEGPPIILGFVARNPDPVGNDYLNGAAVLVGGEHRHTVQKTLLPSYDVFDEDRYFEPGVNTEPVSINGVRIGITICEDIWSSPEHWNTVRYPVDPFVQLAAKGVDLMVNISASPYTLGKSALRREIVGGKAKEHGVPVVYVNQVGAHDELIFDGRSMVIRPDGETALEMAAFEEDVQVFNLHNLAESTVETAGLSEEEEVYRALVLGVRDYVRKSGFNAICLGLSGGIDSALTAVIAADALGPENVHGLAMPTRYSSTHSVEDAEALAKNLGCRCDVVSIDEVFASFLLQMKPVFEGRDEDVTEENMQARIRGMTLMALSNKTGALLLTTGNKSEMAVGYCTLYGDMCGALAVIADVPKTLVYRVARWINRDEERIPWRTLEKPPSAELRPGQVDQDSLPPYSLLDAIIQGVVEDGRSVKDLADTVPLPLQEIDRIVRLIHLNEYKRRQAPPVLKVTSKAFGVGRRMPIVMGHKEWR